MRLISLVGGTLLLVALGACESPDEGGKTSQGITSKEVQEKATAAVKAISDFAKQKNDTFSKQMEAQLAELEAKIRRLNARVSELGADASQDLKDMVDKMGRQSQETRQQLAELGSAAGDRVEALKDNINKQVGDLKETYDKADSSTK